LLVQRRLYSVDRTKGNYARNLRSLPKGGDGRIGRKQVGVSCGVSLGCLLTKGEIWSV
jgi:hypothetical protein